MATLLQDLRLGFRSLARSPGFTLVAILTLALGIGCNGMIFSIVNASLLRPFSYPDSEELVILTKAHLQRGARGVWLSPREYRILRENARSFDGLAAVDDGESILSSVDEPMRVKSARVTASVFRVIGGGMILGRGFLPEEDLPGSGLVAVLSEGLWRRQFGADRSILDRQIQIDGAPATVVGVASASAQFPDTKEAQLLVPLQMDSTGDGSSFLLVIARLADGVGIDQARAEMRALAPRLAEVRNDAGEEWILEAQTLRDFQSGESRPALLLAVLAVFVVLLVACANVANLLLQRGMERAREMAIRAALGGGRGQLVRQLLTEGLILALTGCALGLPVAAALLDLYLRLLPAERLPVDASNYGIDGVVIGYLVGLSLLTTVLFSLVPSLRATQIKLHRELGEAGTRSSSGRQQRRLQSLLVIAEIGLSLVLLVIAGLLTKSLRNVQKISPGFETHNLLTVPIHLPEARYPNDARRITACESILARVAVVPGVRAVGASGYIPVMDWAGTRMLIEGQTPEEQERNPLAGLHMVAGNFFPALGLPILKGRAFTPRDAEGAPSVVVINQTMAERFWPNQEPLGERMKRDPEGEWLQVVGVVGDIKSWGLDNQAPTLEVYLPFRQSKVGETLNFLIRTESEPTAMLPAIRRAVAEIDRHVPFDGAATMTHLIDSTLWRQRISSELVSVFAVFALLIATVGIYGTVSYAVAQRRDEIGIRMALGAQIRDVLGMVLRQALGLVAIGVVLGAVAAFITAKLISAQLFGVSSADPVTFLGVSLLMSGVTLLATFLPAQRAARGDPRAVLYRNYK